MKTVKISLNSIDKVKAFVNEVTKFSKNFINVVLAVNIEVDWS